MKNKKLVSIIVAVRNEEQHLAECLDSLLAQSYKSFEIIIIDGASDDKTISIAKKYIKKYPQKISLLHNPAQRVAEGRNMGYDAARGDYIGFIDGHSYADTNWIKTLVETLDSQRSTVGAVGSIHYNAGKAKFGIATTHALNTYIGGGSTSYRPGTKIEKVKTAYACMYRKEVLQKIKNQKNEYYNPYFVKGQDAEMNLRIRQAGYDILRNPKAITYYYKRPSLKGFWNQMVNAGFWRGKILLAHPNSLRESLGFVLPASFFIGSLLLLILGMWIFPLSIIGAGLLAIYIFVIIIASTNISIKEKNCYYLISTAIFFSIHTGYSWGLIKSLFLRKHKITDRIKHVRN